MADEKKADDSKLMDTLKKLTQSTQKVDGKFNELADGSVNAATVALRKFSEIVGNNTSDLEKFTDIGSSFGNSINAMKIAAAESRLSLEEFYEVIQKNNKNFAGLGGNVAEGSKVFASFSRSFADSGFTENLKQLGYTSKDLNEILAVQLATTRSAADTSEEGRTRTLKAAAELAYQFDELSKLTGKSRKEQQESYKALQADMQLEAKLRQETAGMTKEQAEEYKSNVMKTIAETQQTMGPAAAQAMKEYYATGTLMTENSRKFAAISGEAGQSLFKSADALKNRDYAAAEAEKKKAQAEIVSLQDNPAYQNLIIYGTKVASVVEDTMKATQPMYDGVKNIIQGAGTQIENLGNRSGEVANALEEMRKSVKKEQEQRDPLTQLMVTTAGRLQDAEAALTRQVRSTMMDPNTGLGKSMQKAAEDRSMGIKPGTTPEEIAAERQKALAAREAGQKVTIGAREEYTEMAKGFKENFVSPASKLLGTTLEIASLGLKIGGEYGTKVFQEAENFKKNLGIKSPDESTTKRDSGTIGLTGMLFEPKDIITKVQKGESVMTESQIKGLMRGSQTDGMEKLLTQISESSRRNAAQAPGSSGLDLEKIAKDITTTTSKVQVTNWPKDFGKIEVKKQESAPAKPAQQAKQEPSSGAQKPAKQTETKPEEKKSTESKPTEKKPVDSKATEKKPTEAKTVAPKESQVSVKRVDSAIDKQPTVKESSTSTTKLTVNGRDVDPNSKEGQAAMKQLDETSKKTQEVIQQLTSSFGAGSKTITLDPKSIEDMAKPLGENFKNIAQDVKQVAPTTKDFKDVTSKETLKSVTENVKDTGTTYKEVKGPSMTKKSSAEFLLDNQITQASSGMRGSSAVDKGALNDALSLSEKEREEKKKKYQEEYDLAQKEVSDRDKRLIEIEKRYEDEGRAADAKNDEEYKRLEAEEKIFLEQRSNAQKNLQALKEVDDIKRKVEDQGYDFEKVNAARLQNLTKESAEAVQKEMKEAIPVKELQGSLAKASESLDDHGKKTLQLVMNDSDEMLETRKRNAKNIIKSEEADIAERQSKIKELENKAAESELSSREKKWLDEEKAEIAKAEERKKFQESDLRAIELAEKARQGILEESNKVTKQAFDTMADDVAEISKVLPDTMSKSQEELEVIADDMRAGITDALPTSQITKSLSDMTMEADEMGADLAESIPTSQITKALSDMTMEADEMSAELADSLPTSQITKALSDLTMEADEMGAELADSIPTSQITKSLSDMTMEADEMGAELADSIPTSQITKSLSDMTMEADEMGADLAESIPTSQITKSLSDMTMEADEIGAELADSIPTSQVTKSLSDMTMEADEIAAELSNTMASSDVMDSMTNMNFKPMEVQHQLGNLEELEKGDMDEITPEPKKPKALTEGFKMPSLGQLAMDSSGMPLVSKQQQKNLASDMKKDTSQDDAETKKLKRQQEQAQGKQAEAKKSDSKDEKSQSKPSNKTLDDVVKVLETLNTSVNKLTLKVEESAKNQISATKSALTGNLFNK